MTDAMKTLSGAPLSRLAFGAMQFGGGADETNSAAMFEACVAAGINHFDTAHIYTGGASERILGALVQAERDKHFIATKVAVDKPASNDAMWQSLDESRNRMKLDVVDALYLHRFHPETDLDIAFETFADMQQKGIIRYIALSNFAAWEVMKAQIAAAKQGLAVKLLQPMYNLVKRQAEVEILPMAVDQKITIAAYSPLGGGLLTGKYSSGGTGRLTQNEMYSNRYAPEYMHSAAQKLAELAACASIHPATLAVAWVARHQARPVPITSARNCEQLAPSLAAMSYEMDDELYVALSALVPAPPPATDRLEEAS